MIDYRRTASRRICSTKLRKASITTMNLEMFLVVSVLSFAIIPGITGQQIDFDTVVDFNRTSENSSNYYWTSEGTVVLTPGDLVGFEPKVVVRTTQNLCTVDLSECPTDATQSSDNSCYCKKKQDDRYVIVVGTRTSELQPDATLEVMVPGRGPLANITRAVSIGTVPNLTGRRAGRGVGERKPNRPTGSRLNSLVETNDVTVVSSPPTRLEGVTRHLAVKCCFRAGPDSDFSSLMSLILSRTDSDDNSNTFTELATMTIHSQGKVMVEDAILGATATGYFSPQNDAAFLVLEWTDPSSQVEGSYHCQAYGMDRRGHPRVSYNVTSVVAAKENVEELVEYVKFLDKAQDECDIFKANVTDILVEASSTFRGHRYVLSTPVARNLTTSLRLCHLWGGYLVEINDKEEYDFVWNFATIHMTVLDELALGAWDEGHEKVWTYIRTEKPVEYIYKQTSNRGNGVNCLSISLKSYKGMVDEPCSGTAYKGSKLYRFLCEIPIMN